MRPPYPTEPFGTLDYASAVKPAALGANLLNECVEIDRLVYNLSGLNCTDARYLNTLRTLSSEYTQELISTISDRYFTRALNVAVTIYDTRVTSIVAYYCFMSGIVRLAIIDAPLNKTLIWHFAYENPNAIDSVTEHLKVGMQRWELAELETLT